MARILSVSERIRLFKEINRIHKRIYGWKMIYQNAWYGAGRIDIENDVRFDPLHEKWVPMKKSDIGKYYFKDEKGKDMTSLQGIFAWVAYYFYHLNPYNFSESTKKRLVDDDFISNGLRKRIKPDVNHPVDCLRTMIDVQQRKENGQIWISSNWLYHYDCYGSGPGFGSEIYETLDEAAVGDENVARELKAKYEEIIDSNRYEFEKALGRYFKGEKLQSKHWYGGYLFTASKERRIKTLEQLDEALVAEEKHFSDTTDEFIRWFTSNGLCLGKVAEESLRRRVRAFYEAFLSNIAKEWCRLLVEEDKTEPSDVYLWWGGEPNSDACYAFLTLFFEVNPNDIGTPRFDKKVSRNLRAIINIAEKKRDILASYKEYEPSVWKSVFY